MKRRLVALVATVTAALAIMPVAPAAAVDVVTITGAGWGHGRGMGQYGAVGYAVDHGWSTEQILAHYYGGTGPGTVGNPPFSVELLGWRGRGLLAHAPDLTVNGAPAGAPFVSVSRTGPNTFDLSTGPGCGGPWSPPQPLPPGRVVLTSGSGAIEVCEDARLRGYRGELVVVDRGSESATVNWLPLETYLRGVVPREMPASWAGLAGGRGAAALRAQAVAARSYAMAGNYSSYANACDTQACQVYGGAWTRAGGTHSSLEDPRSDAAISATAGVVRMHPDGRVARTEFSSSTGGWTAGGTFPPVPDAGDAYAGNPNRSWTVSFTLDDLARRFGVGRVLGITVTERNGLGPFGGRVRRLALATDGGTRTFTGDQVRQRLGLKSDLFGVSTVPYPVSQALVRALFADILGRTLDPNDLGGWPAEVSLGRLRDVTATIALSRERAYGVVDRLYQAALGRHADSSGRDGWADVFTRSGSQVPLRVGIWGSGEAASRAGSPESWVVALYRGVLGREPGPVEVAGWASEVRRHGYPAVAGAIAGSVEGRMGLVAEYYGAMLGRAPDPVGLAGFVLHFAGAGDLTVPVAIAGSAEYHARALQRFPVP